MVNNGPCYAGSGDPYGGNSNYVEAVVSQPIKTMFGAVIGNSSNVTVATTWPGTTPDCSSNCSTCTTTNNKGCEVNVKLTYAFTFVVPFLKRTTVNQSASSQKVIQQ